MRYCLAPALLVSGLVAGVSRANPELLPERVAKAAQERIDAGTYQALVFGVVEGDKSDVFTFGKLDGDRAPDGGGDTANGRNGETAKRRGDEEGGCLCHESG